MAPPVLSLLLAAAAAPVAISVPHGPKFSWDTLPVFIHSSNASGPISAAGLATMARFPMVTVEKFQGRWSVSLCVSLCVSVCLCVSLCLSVSL